jgi:hypothetical protein
MENSMRELDFVDAVRCASLSKAHGQGCCGGKAFIGCHELRLPVATELPLVGHVDDWDRGLGGAVD